MIRALSLATILAAAIALPAIAQTTPAQAPPAPVTAVAKLTLTAEQVKTWIGKPVYSSDDKKIGEVIAFARGADDMVTEMHAGIGGFLGLGETNVRLMPGQITLQADRVVLNVTAAQAKDLPKVLK
jgi:PRC-barrel domain